jgi:hypothetical protein
MIAVEQVEKIFREEHGRVLPESLYHTLKGQRDDIVPNVLGPVLVEFFIAVNCSLNRLGEPA